MGTRARLIPMLNAIRSMLSSSFDLVGIGTLDGKRAFMKLYPGNQRTKIEPRIYLTYTVGKAFSGMARTEISVVEVRTRVIQYQ